MTKLFKENMTGWFNNFMLKHNNEQLRDNVVIETVYNEVIEEPKYSFIRFNHVTEIALHDNDIDYFDDIYEVLERRGLIT